jgi:hypothetical protein
MSEQRIRIVLDIDGMGATIGTIGIESMETSVSDIIAGDEESANLTRDAIGRWLNALRRRAKELRGAGA